MNPPNIADRDQLPFNNLSQEQFQSIIQQSNLHLTENENIKLKKLIFNPLSNDRGKFFLTVDTQIDPDSNYNNNTLFTILITVIIMTKKHLRD